MATKPIESISSSTSISQICPRYEHAAQLLGKRWTGLLLNALLEGPRRFCELTSLVEGLSDRVLSDRLRELETENIVQRIVYPQIPVRVEYQLTEKGRALKPVVDADSYLGAGMDTIARTSYTFYAFFHRRERAKYGCRLYRKSPVATKRLFKDLYGKFMGTLAYGLHYPEDSSHTRLYILYATSSQS